MRHWFTIVLLLFGLTLTRCGSDSEETADTSPPSEPPAQVGMMEVEGSSVQINWIRNLTESFKSAELAFSLGDSTNAIWTAESLLTVSEAALDTLPVDAQMARFLLIFSSDVYASLRNWYTLTGRIDEAQELSRRYIELADRMKRRRDSLSKTVP
ncbi:MAG: hypothetical protein Kow0074_13910 [Candidatus Zixiibacteriota bacterium]